MRGYAAGYNRALQQVQADVYCLLNSDVAVTEGWLSPVLKCFEDPQIAMVQPKILDYKRLLISSMQGSRRLCR